MSFFYQYCSFYITIFLSDPSKIDALYSVHLIDVTLVDEERVIDVVADMTGVRDGLEVDIG